MAESSKLRRLRELRQLVANDRIRPDEIKSLQLMDTDGTMVRLDSPEAVEALDRRIAAEVGTE